MGDWTGGNRRDDGERAREHPILRFLCIFMPAEVGEERKEHRRKFHAREPASAGPLHSLLSPLKELYF